MSLWAVEPQSTLLVWLAVGCLVALAQWHACRAVGAVSPAAANERDAANRRSWIVASALLAGLFWSTSSAFLFPEGSVVHQLLLAFILAAVCAVWLPMFALARITLLVFAAPVLLPIAFGLLTSPQAPQTTMGSLLLLLFAALVAIAHAVNRMFHAESAARRALYHQATHDTLVGLANRAEFYRRAHALDALGAHSYAVLFIDVDHFKQVNDTAGHAAGDELLRQIGVILKRGIRKGDTAARLGGDEFAILMANCGEHEAIPVATAILECINALSFVRDGVSVSVSASIGVACHPERGTSVACVLEAADYACYGAKRMGRNRIEIAAPPARDTRPAPVSTFDASKLGFVAHPST
jgi:diguanylate cyclase (GGDEF)-like protein